MKSMKNSDPLFIPPREGVIFRKMIVTGVVAVIVIALYDICLALISSPSSFGVFAGVVGLGALCYGVYLAWRKIWGANSI